MPATLTPPKTLPALTTGIALWLSVPGPVRTQLRARVPLECRDRDGSESLMLSVGSGTPLRWLQVGAVASGNLLCRLWEVRTRATVKLAEAETPADGLTLVLQKWAKDHGLSG